MRPAGALINRLTWDPSGRRVTLALLVTAVMAAVVVLAIHAGWLRVPAGTADAAASVLADYGLLAMFAIFVIEGAMLLYFAPSESLVPTAVLLLTDSPADVVLVVAVSVVGATVGQLALFALARRGGRDWLCERRWFPLGRARLARFDAWFERWGPLVVPVSNALPFTRGMLTVPAGLSDMDLRTFAVLSALGTLAFETVLAAATLGVLAWLA